MRLALIAVLLAGCNLYFGGPTHVEDDVECGAPDPGPVVLVRDPTTGTCNAEDLGGGCGCAPCGGAEAAGSLCEGPCEDLDENTCLATAGCHAAFRSDHGAPSVFAGCWDIAPQPVEQGTCDGLDAWTCSQHDDCITRFNGADYGDCEPEGALSCDNTQCLAGSHCEETCAQTDCGPGSGSCASTCSPVCVPDGDSCDTVDCAPGTTCVVSCSSSCGDGSGGTCSVACVPTGACESLTTESDCISAGCVPIYDGMNCTCDASGACTCESETFARCTSGGNP